ncbi:hypothetical protein QJQ45_015147, partial [Haematococcus lacustris]
ASGASDTAEVKTNSLYRGRLQSDLYEARRVHNNKQRSVRAKQKAKERKQAERAAQQAGDGSVSASQPSQDAEAMPGAAAPPAKGVAKRSRGRVAEVLAGVGGPLPSIAIECTFALIAPTLKEVCGAVGVAAWLLGQTGSSCSGLAAEKIGQGGDGGGGEGGKPPLAATLFQHQVVRSLMKQAEYAVVANKNAEQPLPLALTGFSGQVVEVGKVMGAPGWPVLRHECPVAQAFPGKQLVIMSPDAEAALLPMGGEPLNPQAVYVVGGIVDRTVRKGLTLEYAAAAGLTAVRLPVLEYAAELGLGKGTTKRPVLNVNDVVVALLEYHRTGKKRWWYYIPYASALCFCSEMAGLGVWDSFTNRALDETSASLKTLGVALDTRLVWGKGAIALTTGVTVILALAMLALGVGRSLIAYQADRTGASRMGGRLMTWMWLCAVFILLWWSLTMWFMILLLGELLWSAGALVVTSAARAQLACLSLSGVWWGAAQVGADTARHVPASMAVEINSTKGGSLCSTRCVDLSVFDFALGNTTCLCDLNAIVKADTAMSLAMHQMIGSITGAIMMLVAGGWVLMTSAAEFGVTRRERQLLRRIAKARAASASGEGAKLLNGVEGSSGALGGKNKKGGKKGGGGPEVIVDQETGEILDVEMSSISLGSRTRDGADNAPSAGGGGGSSKGVVGSLLSASKSAGRTVGKGVYLGGKVDAGQHRQPAEGRQMMRSRLSPGEEGYTAPCTPGRHRDGCWPDIPFVKNQLTTLGIGDAEVDEAPPLNVELNATPGYFLAGPGLT